MNEDLWGNIEIEKSVEAIEDNLAIDILREQASLISKKTEGAVKGSFAKIEYESPLEPINNALNGLNISFEVDDKPELCNISELYKKKKYKFEIYNTQYKYRIFTVDYCEGFPFYILSDEDICKELSLNEKEAIGSNDELIRLVGRILASEKVRFVLQKMIGQDSTVREGILKEFIERNPGLSSNVIAKELKWTLANTRRTLLKLAKEGEIQKEGTGKTERWNRI